MSTSVYVAWGIIFAFPLLGQVATSGRILGVITDATGAVIPNASVSCIGEGTGVHLDANASEAGAYTCPNLVAGVYEVEVVAPGFARQIVRRVKVDVGLPTTVDVRLEVGTTAESVQVEAQATPIITSTASITTTVTGRQITELPLSTRSALDMAFLMPGAAGGGGPRYSSFNGLPKGALNVSVDGVNVQDNLLKSSSGGGFYTYIQPRIDAVDEVTVSTAANSASTGEGSVQVAFVTKRGTNEWHGGVFEEIRNDYFNANTWFNNTNKLPRQKLRLNQFGGKLGGPIIKNKLFIFGVWDEFRLPNSISRTRTVLTTRAIGGDFTYRGLDGATRTINVLQVAQANGFRATPDANIAGLLRKIDSLRGGGEVGITASDLFRDTMRFNNAGSQRRYFPTVRMDYNLNDRMQIEGIYYYQGFRSMPDTLNGYDRTYPGFETLNARPAEGAQNSNRFQASTAFRWAISPVINNEFRLGLNGGTVVFAGGMDESLYPNNTRLGFPLGLTSPLNLPRDSRRNTPIWQLSDTLGWQKGQHTLSFGFGLTKVTSWDSSLGTAVPLASLGITGTDPAAGFFTSANFPGITTNDIANAQNLYALLTGRLSGVAGVVNVDETSLKYVPYAALTRREKQDQFGAFVTDNWRLRPFLTLSLGLRWDYQGVPGMSNGIYSMPEGGMAGLYGVSGLDNLFKPGNTPGAPTNYVAAGQAWAKKFNNWAPSAGLAWTPNSDNFLLRSLFGKNGAFRAGYSINFNREGLNNYRSLAGANPGPTAAAALVADRDFKAGSLFYDAKVPPLVTFPASYGYPLPLSGFTYTSSASVNWFDPALQTPKVHSWSVGVQREVAKDTVLEVRYVGNYAPNLWRQLNINEVNVFENGFLKEFMVAQNNLAICQANLAACGGTPRFDNRGLPGQAPTPIMSAAFTGVSAGSSFASSSFVTNLQQGTAGGFANTLATSATFMPNIVRGGYPSNLFLANPGAAGGGSYLLQNGAFSSYQSLQIEVRRRMAAGLLLNASYVYSKGLTDFYGDDSGSFNGVTTQRNYALNKGLSPYDIRHAGKFNFLYELPFGAGKPWLSTGNRFVKELVGGWQVAGIGRIQSGQPFQLQSGRATFNQNNSGVLPLVDRGELQSKVKVTKTGSGLVYFFDRDAIGADGRALPSVLNVPTKPGELGYHVFLYGLPLVRIDGTIAKRINITERVNMEMRAQVLNVLNTVNFMVGSPSSATATVNITGTTFGRTTNYYQDFNGSQDPGGRVIHLVFRLNF